MSRLKRSRADVTPHQTTPEGATSIAPPAGAPPIKKGGKKRHRRPEQTKKDKRVRAAIRRAAYRAARGTLSRRTVKALRWDRTSQRATLTSSTQMPPLMPTLLDTRPRDFGTDAGLDLMTHTALREDVFGLYQNGQVTAPNAAIIGDIGAAKSTLTKVAVERLVSCGGKAVVFDRKKQMRSGSGYTSGEYGLAADLIGGTRVVLNPGSRHSVRVNVLDPRIATTTGTDDPDSPLGQDRLLIMVTEAALGARLTVEETRALTLAHRAVLREAREQGRVGVLSDVISWLQRPVKDEHLPSISVEEITRWGLAPALALLRYVDGDLQGLIDGETRGADGGPLDLDAPLLVIDTSALPMGSTQLEVMMAVMTAYLMASWVQQPGIQKLVVVEEGYSADGLGIVPAFFRDLAKRARGVGAATWSVFHHVSDLPMGSPLRSLVTEAEILMVFRQDKPTDAQEALAMLDLDASWTEVLETLPKGVHLRRRGRKLPATVVELVRSDLEVAMTYTDDAMNAVAAAETLAEVAA